MSKLSFSLSFAISLLLLEFGPLVKLSPASPPLLQRVIKGQDTPEDIPNFLAWRFFIDAIVNASANSYIDSYLSGKMNLAPFWQGQPILRDEVVALLTDESLRAQHKMKIIDNRCAQLLQEQQKGIRQLTEQAFEQQQLALRRSQVTLLTKTCESIRNELIKLDPNSGPKIWNAIIDFVDTHIKMGITRATDDKPSDQALEEIWLTFEPQKIK